MESGRNAAASRTFRAGAVAVDQPTTPSSKSSGLKRKVLIAAGGFLVVIVGLGALGSTVEPDTASPSVTSSSTTSTSEPESTESPREPIAFGDETTIAQGEAAPETTEAPVVSTTTTTTIPPATTIAEEEDQVAASAFPTDADWEALEQTMAETCRLVDGVDTMAFTGVDDYWLRMYDRWATLSDQVIWQPYFEIVNGEGQVVSPESVPTWMKSDRARFSQMFDCWAEVREVDEFFEPLEIEDFSRLTERGAPSRGNFTGEAALHDS